MSNGDQRGRARPAIPSLEELRKLSPDAIRERYLRPAPEEDQVPEGNVELIFGGFIRNRSRDTGTGVTDGSARCPSCGSERTAPIS